MQQALRSYFEAERAESLLLVAIGLAAIGLSLWLLWRYGGPLYRGLGVALIAVGIIQLVVGGTVLLRTPGQVATLEAELQSKPQALRAAETARMATVMKSFELYKYIEITFILLGLVGTLAVAAPFWRGIAMGMLVQGAVMLPFDMIAMSRGATYITALAGIK